MIRSRLRMSARTCARHPRVPHTIDEAGIAQARRWVLEADHLRDGAEFGALNPRQRAALRKRAASADHRAVWCVEVIART